MVTINKTFNLNVNTEPGLATSRDGLIFDITSDAGVVVGEYVDEGAIWVQSTGDVTIAQPTLDPTFIGSGYTWIATAAMVEPPGLARQGWDSRNSGTSSFGPLDIYDADLGVGFPLTITPTSGEPQAVLLYRGRDTVQAGGSYTGAGAIIVVMVCYEEPSATAICPEWVQCPDGKRQYTTADINYDVITPVAIPGGAVEPTWDNIAYLHKRCYMHTGSLEWSQKGECNPEYTQLFYPAYQAEYTSAVLIGAVSDSTDRNKLINRIVRDGLYVDASVRYHDHKGWTAGAGFGHGGGPMRWMAGLFLEDEELKSTPDTIYNRYTKSHSQAFAEDDSYFLSTPGAVETSARWIFGIPNASVDWPGADSHHYNSTARDETGEREPHWIATSEKTAQGGTSNTIQLAADEDRMDGTWQTRAIWIYNGTNGGLGEGLSVLDQDDWDEGTKTATMDGTWTVNPTASTDYEVCTVGPAYQPIVTSAHAAAAIAIGLTGSANAADFTGQQDAFWGMFKRWLNETRPSPQPRWIWDTTAIGDPEWIYGDVYNGNWAQQFAATAEANFPIPSILATLELPMTTGGERVNAVLTSATTASVTVTTRQASGTVYWVSTRSIARPSITQIVAGQDHTGAAGLESGSETVTVAGTQSWSVVVDNTDRYTHIVYYSSSEYSARERSRKLVGTQWGLSYSTTFATDTSDEWAAFKQAGDAVLAYDSGGQRLSVTQKAAWRGAWLTLPFQFEKGLDYTFTINATNASAGAVMDFQLGTFIGEETNAETSLMDGFSEQISYGTTADMSHTITAQGDQFYLAVKLRAGSVDDVFHINSVTVTQV